MSRYLDTAGARKWLAARAEALRGVILKRLQCFGRLLFRKDARSELGPGAEIGNGKGAQLPMVDEEVGMPPGLISSGLAPLPKPREKFFLRDKAWRAYRQLQWVSARLRPGRSRQSEETGVVSGAGSAEAQEERRQAELDAEGAALKADCAALQAEIARLEAVIKKRV